MQIVRTEEHVGRHCSLRGATVRERSAAARTATHVRVSLIF